uniref:Uncharacterized protein n=2 Tax=Oryza TaxID=4527 RepID=A0A0E0PNH2_ORYRU
MADHGTGRRRSTTTTLTLSALRRAIASFARSNAASAHALSDSALSTPFTTASPPPPPDAPAGGGSTALGREHPGGDGGPLLRKHARTTSHAISLVTTSHSPSLARIRHSSSSARSVTVTSGSDVTYGFR